MNESDGYVFTQNAIASDFAYTYPNFTLGSIDFYKAIKH